MAETGDVNFPKNCSGDLDTHAAGGSCDDIAGGIQIIGIQIDHFLFCDFFDLSTRHLADAVPFGITCAFGNLGGLLQQNSCGRCFRNKAKDRSW